MAFGRHKQKNYKTGRQVLIMVAELLVVLILLIMVFGLYQWARIRHDKLDRDNLEVYQDTGPYTNIALFGLDSRDGETGAGNNSDTMIIASISNKTKEVKLVSVYRDCIMRQKDGSYGKANSAYSRGGGEAAIAELNRNLDLDIRNYVAVSFAAMVKAIDAVDGITVDVKKDEVKWINGYVLEIAKCYDMKPTGVKRSGKQTLNGIQATAYARIRYTKGGDFRRTERQRYVLTELLKKMKKAKAKQLSKLIDQIMPLISTSFSAKEVLGLGLGLSKYELKESKGFPFEVTTMNNPRGLQGSYVVPADLITNVKELHKYLFDNSSYSPSQNVQDISNDIIYLTGVYAGATNQYDQDAKTQ